MRPATRTKSPRACAIIVAVAEEVPVGVGAGLFVRGPLHYPGPRTLFAIEKTEIGGVEERARGVVDQRPARARDQALADGLLGLAAAARRRGCASCLADFRGRRAGMPGDVLAVDGEGDGEIVGGEVAIARVGLCREISAVV